MPELRDATVRVGIAGLNGTGITSGEKLDITTRLTAIEGTTIPAVLDDLTDVSGTPASGDLLQYDGSGWVPTTPASTTITVPFMIPLLVGYGGVGITPGGAGDIALNFACTVTGWRVTNVPSGSVQFGVWKNSVQIHGTNPPKVTSGTSASGDVTGWTATTLASGDILGFSVTSVTTSTEATLNLYLTRTIG